MIILNVEVKKTMKDLIKTNDCFLRNKKAQVFANLSALGIGIAGLAIRI